ncbi:hypothetical protein D3C83_269870 [compost metagenome]
MLAFGTDLTTFEFYNNDHDNRKGVLQGGIRYIVPGTQTFSRGPNYQRNWAFQRVQHCRHVLQRKE